MNAKAKGSIPTLNSEKLKISTNFKTKTINFTISNKYTHDRATI